MATAPPKPLSPIIRKMLGYVWSEVEPRIDVLVTSLIAKANALYADLKVKLRAYLAA